MIDLTISEHLKIEYDPVADALYITVKEGKVADTIEVTDCIFVDIDADKKLIGIEVLAPENLTATARKKAFERLASKYHAKEILSLRPEKVPEVCQPA